MFILSFEKKYQIIKRRIPLTDLTTPPVCAGPRQELYFLGICCCLLVLNDLRLVVVVDIDTFFSHTVGSTADIFFQLYQNPFFFTVGKFVDYFSSFHIGNILFFIGSLYFIDPKICNDFGDSIKC